MNTRAILFDLDGTLSDPKVGICASMRYALERLGLQAPPIEELTWAIGPPMQDSMTSLVGAARAEEAVRFYRERYGTVGLFENVVYDGVPEMLARLRDDGATLYVATSKVERFAQRIIDRFGLARFFRRIYGARADGRLSNKDELVAHILEREGAGAARAIMVGDRVFDARAARANGLPSVCARWGYGGSREIAEAGFDGFADTPADVAAVLRAIERSSA